MSPKERVEGGLMRIDDVASFLGMSRSWVYHQLTKGALPYVRIADGRRIPRSAVVEMAAANLVEAGKG